MCGHAPCVKKVDIRARRPTSVPSDPLLLVSSSCPGGRRGRSGPPRTCQADGVPRGPSSPSPLCPHPLRGPVPLRRSWSLRRAFLSARRQRWRRDPACRREVLRPIPNTLKGCLHLCSRNASEQPEHVGLKEDRVPLVGKTRRSRLRRRGVMSAHICLRSFMSAETNLLPGRLTWTCW